MRNQGRGCSNTALRGVVAAAMLLSAASMPMAVNAQKSVAATSMGAAQSSARLVTGTVLDPSGAPVAGATISTNIKGLGAVTDETGVFRIKVPTGKKVTQLKATFIGMLPKTIDYRQGATVVFHMEENSQELGEVVVTGLFNRKESSFTGSASTFTSQDLKRGGNRTFSRVCRHSSRHW